MPVDGNAPVDSDEVSESDTDENGGFEDVPISALIDVRAFLMLPAFFHRFVLFG